MKLYQEMFGRNFNLSFGVEDYPYASEREDESYSRYTVVEALNVGDSESPEIEANQDSNFQAEFELF